jgi:hypothetical protein
LTLDVVRTAAGALIVALMSVQPRPAVVDSDYQVTLAGSPVPSGTVWLYYWGSNYFDPLKLADVSNGQLHLSLSSETMRENKDPGLTVLVALEVPGVGWYGPREVENVQGLERAVDGLGTAGMARGKRAIDLAPAVDQILRLQNLDGTARANQEVSLWAFGTIIGHCAVPAGFGELRVATDSRGTAAFRAPSGSLFLVAEHFDNNDERQTLEELRAGSEHTFRSRWDKRPVRDFVFRIRRPDGAPAKAEVVAEGDGCARSGGLLGRTDARGDVATRFSLDDGFTGISIGGEDDGDRDVLGTEEYRELERTGSVTITWPRTPK